MHGYSEREAERLRDQAAAVRDLLHHDTRYAAGSRVLEAGCGVGAQTISLARNSPTAQLVSVDLSRPSLDSAQAMARRENLANVAFVETDVFHLPFPNQRFDHVFVCYLLEHLTHPLKALAVLARVLKRGGSITVIEGDHGSCYFHPATPEAVRAWNCLIEVQAALGGNSLIGRQLYPLLAGAGFREIAVSPRNVYADHSRPGLRDGFVGKTITPMVEGVERQAIEMGLIDAPAWRKGIQDLYTIAQSPEGVFNYTFFKATAVR